ncbi:hypothetical protein HRI_002928200 [Hibiscus trionum]|uniref:GATA-type domain-containing protein n=1 Tax=Hibiscus trionum TaxID=183268 RepID=A0A9W7IAS9_HIBTR|nr:hypothetical protein HRI_002928200 [Hibiscus trionum]
MTPPLPRKPANFGQVNYYVTGDGGSSDQLNKFQYPVHNAIRVCSDCNTSTTPLWRSGPRGPKSLCNACGIRQRKARRALEAAAVVADATSLKKSGRVCKKQLKIKEFGLSLSKKSGWRRVFPRDVEDAAILLMELSCGLLHT